MCADMNSPIEIISVVVVCGLEKLCGQVSGIVDFRFFGSGVENESALLVECQERFPGIF